MNNRKPQRKIPIRSAVRMALASVVNTGRPLDVGIGDPDTSPTSLGLPPTQPAAMCQHHLYVRAVCGKPLGETSS